MQLLIFIPFLIIFTGIGLSYKYLLPAMIGWIVCALGVLIGTGTAIALFITGHSWILVLVAALPLMVTMPMVINDLRYPRINDVTTNTEHPSTFVAALHAVPNIGRDMNFPKGNALIVRQNYKNVHPLLFDEPLTDVFQHLINIAKHQDGWMITHNDTDMRKLEAEVTTSFFRFVDDVVITVSDQGGKSRVDMRSKSRDGLVDAGANAKRIQSYSEQVKSVMSMQYWESD